MYLPNHDFCNNYKVSCNHAYSNHYVVIMHIACCVGSWIGFIYLFTNITIKGRS